MNAPLARTRFAFADCRLRPMGEGDRDRVRDWRNQERVRSAMVTDHVIGPDEHARWFARALVDPRAAYRIYEYQQRPLGFVSFTGIDRTHWRCSWAFYLGEADAPRGSGAVMEFLALEEAFGTLGVGKLCCEIFPFNDGVIALHRRFGFEQEGLLRRHYRKSDTWHDMVVMARFSDGWAADRALHFEGLFEGTLP